MESNCISDKLALTDWRNERFNVSSPEDITRLNTIFKEMSPPERLRAFYCNQSLRDAKVLLTSSFGTTAVFLLHLFYRNNIQQPVHFLNTTYHFEETLAYKADLARRFDLKVIELYPEEWKNKFTRENKLWETDPDLCCSVNKVEPMLTVKTQADVWVSGLMAWQNDTRKNLDVFQWRDGVLKFYPI
ncbi:MAG: phosphoadenosine phosphosulfate reductase family protein, partial [Tunicatimonas sp.]